jgi:hypothetical protein
MEEEGSPRNFNHQDAQLHFLRVLITFYTYLFGYPDSLLPQFTISGPIDVLEYNKQTKRIPLVVDTKWRWGNAHGASGHSNIL